MSFYTLEGQDYKDCQFPCSMKLLKTSTSPKGEQMGLVSNIKQELFQ